MKSFTCTNIIKSNNEIPIAYDLQDATGRTVQVSAVKLKKLLRNKQINVVNLLLKRGNIIENPNYQSEVLIAKFKTFGKTCKSDCKHDYYIIENPDTTLVYIPDNVRYLVKVIDGDKPEFCNIECNNLVVTGGNGLVSARSMFCECKAKHIDISQLNTSNIKRMDYMFNSCKALTLDMSNIDTSNVTNMQGMFDCTEFESLDLSEFDTSNVNNMLAMFYYCKAEYLNLSKLNTSNVTNMRVMFCGCTTKVLDLTSFDTSNVENFDQMFEYCTAKSIDLSSFRMKSCIAATRMFAWCYSDVKVKDYKLKEIAEYR